jgi:hypothetical protein
MSARSIGRPCITDGNWHFRCINNGLKINRVIQASSRQYHYDTDVRSDDAVDGLPAFTGFAVC